MNRQQLQRGRASSFFSEKNTEEDVVTHERRPFINDDIKNHNHSKRSMNDQLEKPEVTPEQLERDNNES